MIYRYKGRVFLASNYLSELIEQFKYIPLYIALICFCVNVFTVRYISYFVDKEFYILTVLLIYGLFYLYLSTSIHVSYFGNKSELAFMVKDSNKVYHITIEDVLRKTLIDVMRFLHLDIITPVNHTPSEISMKTISLDNIEEISFNYNQLNITKFDSVIPESFMFEVNPSDQNLIMRWFQSNYPQIKVHYHT